MPLIDDLRENDREIYLPLLGRAADALEKLAGYARHERTCLAGRDEVETCVCGLSALLKEIAGE